MPSDFTIAVDAKRTVSNFEGVHGFMRREVTTRFRTLGQTIRNELRAEIPKRSGRARRAVFSKLERRRQQNDVTVLVGGNLAKAPHLKTLEKGALIRPTTAQKLAIPIGRATTRSGVGRFSAGQLRQTPEAFGYVASFVRNDIVFGERANGRIDALFALKDQTLVTRRSYFKNKARQRRALILAQAREGVRAGLRFQVQGAR